MLNAFYIVYFPCVMYVPDELYMYFYYHFICCLPIPINRESMAYVMI